jgi:hypothetical protein
MDKWRSEWVKKKQNIANRLNSGELGGGYSEGIIILCAVINALSAECWPGKSIDQKRFVELLKEYARVTPETTKISVPLLIGALRSDCRETKANRIQKSFMNFHSSLLLTGDEVDKTEDEILQVCGSLTLKEIRKYSYANILYQEVRCNYMHEYHSGKKADFWAMTSNQQAKISYGNWEGDPNRHIYYHFDWILELTSNLAIVGDSMTNRLPLSFPKTWWIDG